MSNWSTGVLTAAGRNLQAKVEAGAQLVFTRMVMGDGTESIDEVDALIALTSPKHSAAISSYLVDEDICKIESVITSAAVDSAFSVRELGLYAMDPNIGEILYMIAIDSQPDPMPSKNYSPPITISYTLNVIVTSEMSPNIIITPSGLVTVQMLNQAIQNHNNNPNAHETEIVQKIQTHNTSTVSHLDIRDRLNEVSDSVQELWGEDLIEKKLNGDLTISNNATSRPVKLILIDNENITFGDEEFFTRHLEYNADGDITMKEE